MAKGGYCHHATHDGAYCIRPSMSAFLLSCSLEHEIQVNDLTTRSVRKPKRQISFFLWMTAHVQGNWWATTLNGTCREPEEKVTKKFSLMETKVKHWGCVFTWTGRSPRWMNLTPRTKNNKITNNECTNAAENSVTSQARIVEKNEIDIKLGTRKGSQGHPPPWFENNAKW